MIGAGLAIPELAGTARYGIAPARFAAFPALAAAYAAGRGLITLIGDSTLFGLGAGSGGFYGSADGAGAYAPPHRLVGTLAAGGVTAIAGCASFGNRGAYSGAASVPAYYAGSGITPTVGSNQYSGSWPHVSGWGQFAGDNAAGAVFGLDPGIVWDRAEAFLAAPQGLSGGIAQIDIGGAALDSWTVGNANPYLAKRSIAAPRGANIVYVRNAGGYLGLGAIRCWDSATPHVQIENMGNPGWRTGDWLATGYPYSPRALIPQLGSHLVVINLGLNDIHTGVAAATYRANLTALAGDVRATGADVLLTIPHAAQAGSGYRLDAAYVQAIADAATDRGLPPPIDLRMAALTAGDFYDEVHPNAAGYAKLTAVYAARLLG